MRDKLGRPIEIEPLADARWGRVERALFDEEAAGLPSDLPDVPALAQTPPRRPMAALLVLAGALAAISGGLAWRLLAPEARPETTRVETAANGSRVEFGESTIDVGPTSAVRLAGDDSHGTVVTLDRGRVECDVAPRRGRPPFVVEAGSVEVRVVGTHFAVTRAGDAVAVDVQRGKVEVVSEGRPFQVGAGEHWPAEPAASTGSAAGTPPSPAASLDPAGAAPSAPREAHVASPEGRPAKTPRERYDEASRLEAQQPDAALAMYRGLAREGGAWGENALFAAGRLEANRGESDGARHLLHDYLTRYPSGPNADDARRLLDRLR